MPTRAHPTPSYALPSRSIAVHCTDTTASLTVVIDECELMTDGGCWIYKGTGYAMKYIQGRMRPVGRFMLAYKTRESLNVKADACHIRKLICSNPDADDTYAPDCPRSCVNPDHLEWGKHGENCKEREAIQFRFGCNARKRKVKAKPNEVFSNVKSTPSTQEMALQSS